MHAGLNGTETILCNLTLLSLLSAQSVVEETCCRSPQGRVRVSQGEGNVIFELQKLKVEKKKDKHFLRVLEFWISSFGKKHIF